MPEHCIKKKKKDKCKYKIDDLGYITYKPETELEEKIFTKCSFVKPARSKPSKL